MPRLSKIGAAALAAFGWTGLSSVTANYLVVAGGGAGAQAIGGGGGAGGLLTGTTTLNPILSYTVTVGAGGAGIPETAGGISGNDGNNSVFNAITSIGGGGGGAYAVGRPGGSGGGGGISNSAGGAGTAGQGNNGGTSNNSYPQASGGGGGAGAVGANASGSNAGAGGAGLASSISGTSVTYAGGGGGSYNADASGSAGAGGAGGGTAGGNAVASISAAANTGGGSGGGGYYSLAGGNANKGSGNGGSGVVIISYPSPQKFGGGVVTTSGANTIHTFTTSGTLSPLSSLTANFLVVAGGGGGGFNFHTVTTGGGGGAGGYRTSSGLIIDTNSTYLVTVGAGGVGAPNTSTNGGTGTNSAFSSVTSAGGGYGATNAQVGGNGGSGGGASGPNTPGSFAGGLGNTPSTVPAQGFDGGSATQFGGGGGGGSSAAGQIASLGGAGGAGTANSISGASVTYASGGGSNNAGGANVGDGGGRGTGGANNPGFSGGSGVVIISYAGSTQLMAGGTVTISGGNVIHTFTSSGYLTPLTLVGNSLRFRSSASAYLSRTPSTASNRKTWTWSGWVKRGTLGVSQYFFSGGTGGGDTTQTGINFLADNKLNWLGGSGTQYRTTTQVFRDPSAWYHIVLAFDTTLATANDRIKIYVNGTQITAFDNLTNPTQNVDYGVNQAEAHNIGRWTGASGYFDGYLAEVNFIDGQGLTPNSFGTSNQFGVWQPIRYGGSYGTNGFYLKFNNNASTTTLGLDSSPQGNNWTTNNISLTAGSTYDSVTDVPTLTSTTAANYCTWNPVGIYVTTPFDGNLKISGTSAGAHGTMGASSGKFYWESVYTAIGSGEGVLVGIRSTDSIATGAAENVGYYGGGTENGKKVVNGAASAYAATWTTGDVIGVALDLDGGTVTFYKNNVSQGAISFTVGGKNWTSFNWRTGSAGTNTATINFGQQPFAYTAPSGFLPLNTFNL